jgi:DNA-directed RNA polymerase subunit RPC12/RpoP
MDRVCADCRQWCGSNDFSGNQWRKGGGTSRCIDCVNQVVDKRRCAQCGYCRDSDDFSNNQWYKGPGASRCTDCINPPIYSCSDCSRTFDNQNNLEMHKQVHRPRNVGCPICGEERFKSGANAVQHVESGYCTGCRGVDNARNQIYKFASSKPQMQHYLHDVPMLTNGGSTNYVPDFPYNCPDCSKAFRQLSQLLQHQDQKHSNHRLLGYH